MAKESKEIDLLSGLEQFAKELEALKSGQKQKALKSAGGIRAVGQTLKAVKERITQLKEK